MNQFKLFAIMLILGACEQPSSVQTQQSSQLQTTKITTNANCKNLHKVTDIDDLLYQMYTNIDSYCLFEMPTAELEKIWGIRVYDYTLETEHGTPEQNKINIQKIDEVSAEILKLYASKQDYLFVQKSEEFNQKNVIKLKILTNTYKNIAFLEKFPRLLPKPNFIKKPSKTTLISAFATSDFYGHHHEKTSIENTVYFPISYYFWINSTFDESKPILEIDTGLDENSLSFYFINSFQKSEILVKPEGY